MPAEGGAARRMTWLGPDVMVRGFTPEGRILFVTTHGQPFFRNYRAYTLDVAAGCRSSCRSGRSTISRTAPARRW
jgi:tricorn protease